MINPMLTAATVLVRVRVGRAQNGGDQELARYGGNGQKDCGSGHTRDRMPLVAAGAIGCVPGADNADEAAEIVEPAVR